MKEYRRILCFYRAGGADYEVEVRRQREDWRGDATRYLATERTGDASPTAQGLRYLSGGRCPARCATRRLCARSGKVADPIGFRTSRHQRLDD